MVVDLAFSLISDCLVTHQYKGHIDRPHEDMIILIDDVMSQSSLPCSLYGITVSGSIGNMKASLMGIALVAILFSTGLWLL